jgi:hypothetical protein
MQRGDRHRADLVDHRSEVMLSPGLQHAGVASAAVWNAFGQAAADRGAPLLHRLQALLQPRARLVVRADASVAVGTATSAPADRRLRRRSAPAWPTSMKPRSAMEEADRLALAVRVVLDLLAVQQRAQHSQVLAEGASLHRILPITRMAVWPVPMPRNTRPGASWLIEAIECAVTGASRVGATATPVPSRMREVLAGGERQHGVGVRIEHLRIGLPRRSRSPSPRDRRTASSRDAGNDGHAELHAAPSCMAVDAVGDLGRDRALGEIARHRGGSRAVAGP